MTDIATMGLYRNLGTLVADMFLMTVPLEIHCGRAGCGEHMAWSFVVFWTTGQHEEYVGWL